MRRSRYSEARIIKTLKEIESGKLLKELYREYSIAEATYNNWKGKFDGMEASEVKRLKEFEEESRRFKQMYAEFSLDHRILKDIVEKIVARAAR